VTAAAPGSMPSAVVFGYHDVGVRCLAALLDYGVRVPLVVTHEDDPGEERFFASVAALAAKHGIPAITPADANDAATVARVREAAPDFLFSFYYRRMLGSALLAIPRRGAFNMHGSLLPKYRGRAPVNWAVLHGEAETGATLHEMVAKPDAGRIAGQRAVPIGPDDTAGEVMGRVAEAAEALVRGLLPALVDGSLVLRVQDLSQGRYFGGRRPEDGRIDWTHTAAEVHNLVRAVAPPYPGAFTEQRGARIMVLRTRRLPSPPPGTPPHPALFVQGHDCLAACGDGAVLRVEDMAIDGRPATGRDFLARFGLQPIPLAPT
jgi:methionyl-tRNA formyltransferase